MEQCMFPAEEDDSNVFVFKMEVEEDLEEAAEISVGAKIDEATIVQSSDVQLMEIGTQTDQGVLMTTDQGTQSVPMHVDTDCQTMDPVCADVGVQTEDTLAANLAFEFIKAVSSKGILNLLNEKQKRAVASRITDSIDGPPKKRKSSKGPENQQPTASTSFYEKSTMVADMETDEAHIFKCEGIRGHEANVVCEFKCSKITQLIQHRKEVHMYAPLQSHWKIDTKQLRSKDKFKCLKVQAFSRDLCGKEVPSQDMLLQHFTEQVHYNEVKILCQYCVTCATTFCNDLECIKHAMKYLDSCGYID